MAATAAFGVQAKPGDEPPKQAVERRAQEHRLAGPDFKQPETKEAFLKRAAARFDEIDTNSDGTVTPDERRAHFEKMRAEWSQREGRPGPHGGAPRNPAGGNPPGDEAPRR